VLIVENLDMIDKENVCFTRMWPKNRVNNEKENM